MLSGALRWDVTGGGSGDGAAWAAFSPRNVQQVYLRRSTMEELEDRDDFAEVVVGCYARIRVVTGETGEQGMVYRLVKVSPSLSSEREASH